jgi:hypothetical protein
VRSRGTGRRLCVLGARLLAAACVLGVAGEAKAFEVKHTSKGQPVHWTTPSVPFVVDPSVESAVPGSLVAIQAALSGWSGVKDAPALSATAAATTSEPSNDGKNTIYFAPHGYERAGGALAITILTYDDNTGDILDADIIVNGRYDFAVLSADATPDPHAQTVSTEGGNAADDDEQNGEHRTFDLYHVVAHETGHSLGMSDETGDDSALMYLYSKPGDATHRTPAQDDVAGLDDLYPPGATQVSGCSAMIARRGPNESASGFAFAFVLSSILWRRARRVPARRSTASNPHQSA